MTEEEKLSEKSLINWENLSRRLIMLLAFLLPFWVLPIPGFSLGMAKSFLIFGVVLFAVISYLIHLLQTGVFKYPRSIALLILSALLFVVLLSSFFFEPFSVSFFGVGGETGTFAFLLVISLAFFLTVSLFQFENNVLKLLFLLVSSSVIIFIIQLLSSVFNLSFWGMLPNKTDSLIGTWNELSIFFGFIALMAVIFLQFFGSKLSSLDSGRKWRIFLFSIVGISMLTMVFVNFRAVWVVFAIFILTFFVYLFSSFRKNRNFAILPFVIILFSLFFILAQPLVGDLVSSLGADSQDIRPSWNSTGQITKSTLGVGVKNVFLGSGPNTFIYDWFKFKPVEVNQTVFWSARFQKGIGLLPSFVAETGIAGFLGWLFFIGIIFYYGLRSISYSEDDVTKSLLFSSFLGSIYLWIFNIIYVPGNFLFALSFIVTGLFFAMLIKSKILDVKEISLISKTGKGFMVSMAVVLVLITSVAAFYLIFQKYSAVYYYGQGVKSFNEQGDLAKAETYLTKAVRFDKQDRYYRSLSDLGLVRLSEILSNQDQLSQEELSSQFQNVFAFTVQNAQNATQINPEESINWMTLGQVYENVVPLNINGSREAALKVYETALEKNPQDPRSFLASAQVEVQSGNNELARKFLNSALDLKRNYTAALFLLAQIAVQEGNLEEAIMQTEQARLTAPNDAGVLFQLGILYYQKKDYKSAISVLERTVSLNPNYSNARYFLGLAYDQDGRADYAITQFEITKQLNPDNLEVEKILSNLRKGKSALSDISPPELAPEDREDPPIEEEEE